VTLSTHTTLMLRCWSRRSTIWSLFISLAIYVNKYFLWHSEY